MTTCTSLQDPGNPKRYIGSGTLGYRPVVSISSTVSFQVLYLCLVLEEQQDFQDSGKEDEEAFHPMPPYCSVLLLSQGLWNVWLVQQLSADERPAKLCTWQIDCKMVVAVKLENKSSSDPANHLKRTPSPSEHRPRKKVIKKLLSDPNLNLLDYCSEEIQSLPKAVNTQD